MTWRNRNARALPRGFKISPEAREAALGKRTQAYYRIGNLSRYFPHQGARECARRRGQMRYCNLGGMPR